MRDILEYLDKPWDWNNISSNAKITMKDILENPDKPWDWEGISCNPNIIMKDVKENPDKPWNWGWVSCNQNLTWAFINAHPDKSWNWYYLSKNPFTRDKQEFQIQQYRRHLSCYRIQQHWHRIRSDPRHPVGQRRLELDYNREFVNSN